MKKLFLIIGISGGIFFASCNGGENERDDDPRDEKREMMDEDDVDYRDRENKDIDESGENTRNTDRKTQIKIDAEEREVGVEDDDIEIDLKGEDK